jgi:hypothetical protein
MPVMGRSEGNSDLLRVRKGRICRASGDSAVILAALNTPLRLLYCVLGTGHSKRRRSPSPNPPPHHRQRAERPVSR